MKTLRRAMWVAALVAALAGGYLWAAHLSGGALYTFGLPLGGERAELRRMAWSFWEDIRFKDFEAAAAYHTPERRAEVDIPYLIERLFMQKPEMLDVTDIEILMVDMDSSGDRGRVNTRLRVRDLAREEVEDQEVMLYFHREDEHSAWYMELESSLRQLDAEEDKKH
jgi:hypothetical protein